MGIIMKYKNITTILFDNDGILVDTEKFYFQANHKVLAKEGYDLTLERHVDHNMTQGLSVFDFLRDEGVLDGRVLELLNERNSIYKKLIQTELEILPYVEESLEILSKSKKFMMGIVTSSRREMFQAIHAQTGFLKYFDFVIDREDVQKSKPHPEGYLLGLEKSQSKPENTLVIEDSQRGLIAAKAAGVNCWVIPTDMTENQDFSEADNILKNLKEVTDLLLFKSPPAP